MIIDTHCHAWRVWPYDLDVPDPESRGSIGSLLYEMDLHGVDHATVVCARIGGGAGGDGAANEDNNDYVLEAAAALPDRLTAWIDVDCVWRADHHAPGAAGRLAAALESSGARGFTHYVDATNDGWLRTSEADDFFAVAADANVVASMAVGPAWLDDLAVIAARFPSLRILLHHMGMPSHDASRSEQIASLRRIAAIPSVGMKVSGFNYNAVRTWDYPYPESVDLFRTLFDAFGGERLFWGSDYPASRDMLTYRQALEAVRSHCAFVGDDALQRILGANAALLLSDTAA